MRTFYALMALAAISALALTANCSSGSKDPKCGNGKCEAGESHATCPVDCPPICGNGVCETGETNANCPADCPVTNPCNNNGTCEPAIGETNANCPADCPANPCNNNGTCEPAIGETTANCPADCPAGGTCATVPDLTEQDGCNTGEKCTLVDTAGTIDCETAGTAADYAACGSGGADDCLAGAICVGPTGGPYTCLPFCDTAHPCTGGICAAKIGTAAGDAMLCVPFDDCDPYDATGCGTGEGCYVMNAQGDTICAPAGSVAVGGSCTYVDECGIGVQCLGNPGVCTQLCKGDVDCTGTHTCQGIGEFPGDVTLGICAPPA